MTKKIIAKKVLLSKHEKFGIFVNSIGLLADLITISIFSINLVNYKNLENPQSINMLIWLANLLIIPLIYSWGFFAWLLNSKYGKPHEAVIFTGIAFSLLFLLWGILVFEQNWSMILFIQFFLGLFISYALSKWNVLVGINPQNT